MKLFNSRKRATGIEPGMTMTYIKPKHVADEPRIHVSAPRGGMLNVYAQHSCSCGVSVMAIETTPNLDSEPWPEASRVAADRAKALMAAHRIDVFQGVSQ